MKRRDAHRREARELLGRQSLAIVVAHPAHGAPDLRQAAVGEPDLTEPVALLAAQQAPQDLLLGERTEDREVARMVEQPSEANDGLEELRRRVAHAHPRLFGVDREPIDRRRLEEERRDRR
jgi:hypothetical protein